MAIARVKRTRTRARHLAVGPCYSRRTNAYQRPGLFFFSFLFLFFFPLSCKIGADWIGGSSGSRPRWLLPKSTDRAESQCQQPSLLSTLEGTPPGQSQCSDLSNQAGALVALAVSCLFQNHQSLPSRIPDGTANIGRRQALTTHPSTRLYPPCRFVCVPPLLVHSATVGVSSFRLNDIPPCYFVNLMVLFLCIFLFPARHLSPWATSSLKFAAMSLRIPRLPHLQASPHVLTGALCLKNQCRPRGQAPRC